MSQWAWALESVFSKPLWPKRTVVVIRRSTIPPVTFFCVLQQRTHRSASQWYPHMGFHGITMACVRRNDVIPDYRYASALAVVIIILI